MNEDELINEVKKLAEEKMPNFDTIIDLFDMSFIYISEKSAKLSGYMSEEMVGESIHKFMNIPSGDNESFQDILMKTMIGGNVKIPIKTKDGKSIDVLMNFVLIEVDNHPFVATRAAENK
jgi:PAS domain S-box-containing protein